jgi:two-component system sensor histidine kinase KdpD
MRALHPLVSLTVTWTGLLGFSLVLQHGAVNPTTAALGLLVIVLATSAVSRIAVAVANALAATVCFNYFFVPPVGTLHVADWHNWISLAAFVVTGFVASGLSATADARARDVVLRQNEVALARQKADLAAALLASMGHDLRTPLTAIGVAVDNLKDDELPAAQRRAQVELAQAELGRLNRLVREILEMARIEAGAVSIQREWVTPADLVDAACANLRPVLDGRRLHIDADDRMAVFVDPRLTAAALAHLLENASQYSPAGESIDIEGRVDAVGLQLTVRDRGPGLAADELGRVFERFYRGHQAARTTGGSGMGLAITRGLLAAESGRVWAENSPDGGARFSIRVPARCRPVDEEV